MPVHVGALGREIARSFLGEGNYIKRPVLNGQCNIHRVQGLQTQRQHLLSMELKGGGGEKMHLMQLALSTKKLAVGIPECLGFWYSRVVELFR